MIIKIYLDKYFTRSLNEKEFIKKLSCEIK